MRESLRPALSMFLILTFICAILYPFAITLIGRLLFPEKVIGSLILREGQPIGSLLIGQAFSSPKYFWGRPSATSPMPNNASASNGSNLGTKNPAKIKMLKERVDALKAADPYNRSLIPVDLVTASASGLDPEISLAAAYYQASRVARERKLAVEYVNKLIEKQSKGTYFGILGEPRVNVLMLNLALDKLS